MSATHDVYQAMQRLAAGYTPYREPDESPDPPQAEPALKRYTQPESQLSRWLQAPIHGGYAIGLSAQVRTGVLRADDALASTRWRLRVSYNLSALARPDAAVALDEEALCWMWADRWRAHVVGNQATAYNAAPSVNSYGAHVEWDTTEIDAFSAGWAWMILSGSLLFYVST